MSLSTWPSTLPQKPLLGGFGLTAPHAPPLKSEMNSGRMRMRRVSTLAITTVGQSFQMTKAQYQIFVAFVRDTLGHGAARFSGPVWNGSVLVTRVCQLSEGTYSAVPNGMGWKVSFSLLVEGL